jgi:hypothetical protein
MLSRNIEIAAPQSATKIAKALKEKGESTSFRNVESVKGNSKIPNY